MKKTVRTDHMKQCEEMGIKTNAKRYRRYYKAGLLDNLDANYANEVRDYWQKHYNKKVDPILHLAIFNLTNKKDVRIVPAQNMWNEFIPYFNDRNMIAGYRDKNIYDTLFVTEHAPKIHLKRVRGHFFDGNNKQIDENKVEAFLHKQSVKSMIIKPSNTNNGVGINKINFIENEILLDDKVISFKELCEIYGFNFIVQEVIQQHTLIAEPHPSSVNTLRMVTLRWNNEIKYLLTFARFGSNGSVKDNAGGGGVCVGVKDNGEFLDYAVDENCNVYKKHPTTEFTFSKLTKIPNFHKFIGFVKRLHQDVLHMDFVSWDIAIGEDGNPVFIEANFAGATWLYQMATEQPIFRELTAEVVKHVKEQQHIKDRDVGVNIPKLRKNNRRLRRQRKELRKEVKILKRENALLKENINNGKKSKGRIKDFLKKTFN